MVRSSKWSGHSPFKAVMRGSSPARITIVSLRLVGQDASLSSWKYGFESRRDHQQFSCTRVCSYALAREAKRTPSARKPPNIVIISQTHFLCLSASFPTFPILFQIICGIEKTAILWYLLGTTKERKFPHKGGSSNHEKSRNSSELTLD